MDLGRKNDCLLESSHKHMWHWCPEIRSINIDRLEFWNIHLLTFRAKHLHSTSSKIVWKSNWEHFVLLAQCSRTESVNLVNIFMVNFCKPCFCLKVPCVDQPVEITCFLIQLKEFLWSEIFRSWSISASDHLQALPKIQIHLLVSVRLEFLLHAIKIEVVIKELCINLYKEIMPL